MRAEPRCSIRHCTHLLGILQDDMEERGERPYCVAFPTGIPDEIAYGSELHLTKFTGQVGNFVYTKIGAEEEGR